MGMRQAFCGATCCPLLLLFMTPVLSNIASVDCAAWVVSTFRKVVRAVQFDDPKDTSKDPKVVNMNIRKRVMKGAAQQLKLPCCS